MTLSKGFVLGTTALDTRKFSASLVVKVAGSDNPRPGLLWGAVNPVTSTSSMNVSVADQAIFVVSRGKADGANVLTNSGVATVAIGSAPNANSRIDVVWVKQDDTQDGNGDADSNAVFGVTPGTAAASPYKPAIPAGALELATVLVPAGVTATNASGVVITNTVLGTAVVGSPVRYRSVTEMRADSSNLNDGSFAYIKGSGSYYLRGGNFIRFDAGSFVFVNQPSATNINSGTTPGTLGGSTPTYVTSDSFLFPSRTDGVVGPIAVAGWYRVSGNVSFTSNSTGERFLEIQQNDSSLIPAIADRRGASATSNMSVAGLVQFQAGDFVKLKAWQSSGGALNYQSRLAVELVIMS